MVIKIELVMTDDAPPAPYPVDSPPIIARTLLDSPELEAVVKDTGLVDRPALESYLQLGAAPLADAYEVLMASPPILLLVGQEDIDLGLAAPPPPRLTLSTGAWNYVKPDGSNPQRGEIVHANLSKDRLAIHNVDANGVDQSAMLQLVLAGDTIGIGDTVWSVLATASSPEGSWYDFLVEPAEQDPLDGSVTVTFTPVGPAVPPEPLPPPSLPTTTANWDYLKPDASGSHEAAAGQIVHASDSTDTIRVARVDHDGVDRSTVLDLVAPGDTIEIGASTWYVQIVYIAGIWYDFIVLPTTLDAATGVLPVTFERPVLRRA